MNKSKKKEQEWKGWIYQQKEVRKMAREGWSRPKKQKTKLLRLREKKWEDRERKYEKYDEQEIEV